MKCFCGNEMEFCENVFKRSIYNDDVCMTTYVDVYYCSECDETVDVEYSRYECE